MCLYNKTRKYVYTLKNNSSANTLARWRGFLRETPQQKHLANVQLIVGFTIIGGNFGYNKDGRVNIQDKEENMSTNLMTIR